MVMVGPAAGGLASTLRRHFSLLVTYKLHASENYSRRLSYIFN